MMGGGVNFRRKQHLKRIFCQNWHFEALSVKVFEFSVKIGIFEQYLSMPLNFLSKLAF